MTMTGVIEADIIFECRIDESMGDSGEMDTEERRSCPGGNAFGVGIGEDVVELECSDDRWSGCFVDHLRSQFRFEESEGRVW